MSTEIKDIPLIQNEAQQQFELHIDGQIALVAYMEKDNKYALVHTEVPEALEGRGIASILVTKVLTLIESQGRKIIPLCPYVKSFLQRHPEWERIVA